MFETAMNVVILALAIEAVVFVVVLVAYIGTLTQKNMKEAEAAEAQRVAWNSSTELNTALTANMEDAKKKNDEIVKIAAAAMMGDGFSRPSISH